MVTTMASIPLTPESQLIREGERAQAKNPELWSLLDLVKDPEIPVISIWDLGILQGVCLDGTKVRVTITPTYSGCPAMGEIENDIRQVLSAAGYPDIKVIIRLSPAWTTDWMSAAGRQNLEKYGIAPPASSTQPGGLTQVKCPQCGSTNTSLISEFGSTACKALHKCGDCMEPFDYFKCI